MEELTSKDFESKEFEIRKLARLLRVSFTASERIKIGNDMANAIRNLAEKKGELDSVKSRYASDMKALQGEIAGLAERLNSGWEMKQVDCEEVKDFQTGNVFVRRLDTGERVEERAMTAEERQPKLPLETKETELEPEPPAPSSGPVDDGSRSNPFRWKKKGGGKNDGD